MMFPTFHRQNMFLLCLLLPFLLDIPSTFAFCLRPSSNLGQALVTAHPFSVSALSSAADADSDSEDQSSSAAVSSIDSPPMEAGSHAELMYALGVNLARQLGDVRPLVESGEELAQVAKGILDAVVGRFTEEGQVDLLRRRQQELNDLITNRANAIRERLEAAGRDMLQEMLESPGAKRLDSGVVVHVLEHGPQGPGKGKRATRSSSVKIMYHGTLADGTILDSTLATRDAVTFPLAAVIPGWRDGVLAMHEGETAMVGIPPEQAYGNEGTPDGRVPGGSTLFFKIQLLEILSASIGGEVELLGADGNKLLRKGNEDGPGLLGADGRPLV